MPVVTGRSRSFFFFHYLCGELLLNAMESCQTFIGLVLVCKGHLTASAALLSYNVLLSGQTSMWSF